MTISSTTNFFNGFYSNIQKKDSTATISDSFNLRKEIDVEITAFTKKIEGDYSTYTAKDLSQLSYSEIKANYDEIKEVLEARMEEAKDIMNSESFENYQKRLVLSDSSRRQSNSIKEMEVYSEEFNSYFLNEDKITDEMLDKTYGKVTRQNAEVEDLLNFNDKFKIVNFFDNDEINETIFTNYEDNIQVYYEEPKVSNMNGANGYHAGSGASIQGTDLKQILQSIEDAKESIEAHGVLRSTGDNSQFIKGYLINGEEISIAGKIFSIYDVNKANEVEKSDEIKENEQSQTTKEAESNTNVENTIPDYSSYTTAQLRKISFEEAKENYDELIKILEKGLKNISNLNKDDQDNLLAFKSQLEKVNYTDNEELNKTMYDKLQDIEDSKVAVWSNLVIDENIENLQNGEISSFVLNGIAFFQEDITKINSGNEDNEKEKIEKAQKNTAQTGKDHINLDYIINTVSKAVLTNQNAQDKPYSKEYIEAYSNFISKYNEIKNTLFM
ncbi:hypothetical protein [Halarcobacter sp.]|uniref:hypothetical protein n=1 Tax=Halarcobacter sp. TaxID=2321133 RepID=UPI002AAA824C|nr:hypothetical protein [Halarcobacter sp.]